jgi:hypothetical protein
MQHKLKSRAKITIFGAASNAISIASAMEIQMSLDAEQRRNILFVLDGDDDETDDKKRDRINKVLSGTGEEVEQRRRNVFNMLLQYESIASNMQHNKNMCPEEYIYNSLIELPDNNNNPEIVEAAKNIGVVTDPHDYLNKLEQDYDIRDIMNTFMSNREKWESYIRIVNDWMEEKAIEIAADRIE